MLESYRRVIRCRRDVPAIDLYLKSVHADNRERIKYSIHATGIRVDSHAMRVKSAFKLANQLKGLTLHCSLGTWLDGVSLYKNLVRLAYNCRFERTNQI